MAMAWAALASGLPYVALFLVLRLVSMDAGLWAALGTGLVATGLRRWCGGRVSLLQGGTLALFAVLAIFTAATGEELSMTGLRLAMNAGFLGIILASLAVGRPFTLVYARRRVPQAVWGTPLFLTINRHITWVWALAFAVLMADTSADLLLGVPRWADTAIVVLAMAAAVRFTTWYPPFARRRAGWAPQAPFRSAE